MLYFYIKYIEILKTNMLHIYIKFIENKHIIFCIKSSYLKQKMTDILTVKYLLNMYRNVSI